VGYHTEVEGWAWKKCHREAFVNYNESAIIKDSYEWQTETWHEAHIKKQVVLLVRDYTMKSWIKRAHVYLVNAHEVGCIKQNEDSVENRIGNYITYHGYGAPWAFIKFVFATNCEHDSKGDLYHNDKDQSYLCQAETKDARLNIEGKPLNSNLFWLEILFFRIILLIEVVLKLERLWGLEQGSVLLFFPFCFIYH
jgi:hypothetical protein